MSLGDSPSRYPLLLLHLKRKGTKYLPNKLLPWIRKPSRTLNLTGLSERRKRHPCRLQVIFQGIGSRARAKQNPKKHHHLKRLPLQRIFPRHQVNNPPRFPIRMWIHYFLWKCQTGFRSLNQGRKSPLRNKPARYTPKAMSRLHRLICPLGYRRCARWKPSLPKRRPASQISLRKRKDP